MQLDVLAKARALGETLKGSPAYTTLMNAQDAMENDEECVDLLQEMREMEEELQQLSRTQPAESPAVKLKAAQYRGLRQKLDAVKLIADYQEAAEEFQQLMTQVNRIIQYCLSGDEDAGCGGSCEGCTGCS